MTRQTGTETARALRQSMGLAERRAWARLRGGAIDGLKIKRQHRIGPFFVDFACERLRLVIEIDGGVHDRDDVVLNDHLRQVQIEALGWTVVRFDNEVVLHAPWRLDEAILSHARAVSVRD